MTNEEFINSIKLEGEEWRNVAGYEGLYMVSSFGRVASLSSPYKSGDKTFHKKQKILKANLRKKGYLAVTLSNCNKIVHSYLIHRLVAIAFVNNSKNLPFINHKDENPQNNHANNLEWCTNSYNCNYGSHNKRMAETLHKTAYQRRKVIQLTVDMQYIGEYVSIIEAAIATNTNRSCISNCCLGKYKTGGGYKWIYLEDYQNLVNKSKNSQSTSD
jgi:hypothetical protein